LAVQLPAAGLEQLRQALIRNDPHLVQHETIFPPPFQVFADEPVECACAVGYCLWKGNGCKTVGELSAAFAQVCQRADDLLGEIAGSRLFFDWFDGVPRSQMRIELLDELNRLLTVHHSEAAA